MQPWVKVLSSESRTKTLQDDIKCKFSWFLNVHAEYSQDESLSLFSGSAPSSSCFVFSRPYCWQDSGVKSQTCTWGLGDERDRSESSFVFLWHEFSACRGWCMRLLAGRGSEGGSTLQGSAVGRAFAVWLSPSPEGPIPIKHTTSAWQSTRWLIPLSCLFRIRTEENVELSAAGLNAGDSVNVCWIRTCKHKGRGSLSKSNSLFQFIISVKFEVTIDKNCSFGKMQMEVMHWNIWAVIFNWFLYSVANDTHVMALESANDSKNLLQYFQYSPPAGERESKHEQTLAKNNNILYFTPWITWMCWILMMCFIGQVMMLCIDLFTYCTFLVFKYSTEIYNRCTFGYCLEMLKYPTGKIRLQYIIVYSIGNQKIHFSTCKKEMFIFNQGII